MRNKRILSIVAAIALLTVLNAKAHAFENGDFQIWNTDGEDVKIGKDTRLTMEQEFRYDKDASRLFYQHYDWGFAYSFDKRLEMAFGFRFINEWVKKKWMEQDEPYTVLTWKQDIWKFKFEDRNRIEYRHFRFAPDQVRYRNRFMLKYPFDFKTITVAPFVSDEIFISSNSTGYNQNRFETGLEFGLTKYVKCSAEYMQQQVRGKNDKWATANVLWLKGKISF